MSKKAFPGSTRLWAVICLLSHTSQVMAQTTPGSHPETATDSETAVIVSLLPHSADPHGICVDKKLSVSTDYISDLTRTHAFAYNYLYELKAGSLKGGHSDRTFFPAFLSLEIFRKYRTADPVTSNSCRSIYIFTRPLILKDQAFLFRTISSFNGYSTSRIVLDFKNGKCTLAVENYLSIIGGAPTAYPSFRRKTLSPGSDYLYISDSPNS